MQSNVCLFGMIQEVILSSRHKGHICHLKIRDIGKCHLLQFPIYSFPKLYVDIYFFFVHRTIWHVDISTGCCALRVRCAPKLFIVIGSLPCAEKEPRSEKFTWVIRVMGWHLIWQHRSPRRGRGGGGGEQVEMRNEIELINFCQLQGYWVRPDDLTALSNIKIIFLLEDTNNALYGL